MSTSLNKMSVRVVNSSKQRIPNTIKHRNYGTFVIHRFLQLLEYKFKRSHIIIISFSTVVIKLLNVRVSPKIPGKCNIICKYWVFDCVSSLVIKVNITQLRVDAIYHQTNFSKLVVFYYEWYSLSDIATPSMNSALKRIGRSWRVVALQELFNCERVVTFCI